MAQLGTVEIPVLARFGGREYEIGTLSLEVHGSGSEDA